MRHLHYILTCFIFGSLSVFCIVPIDCLFFRRLKIYHDSHEFILEFGTVANTTNNLDGQKQIGGKTKLHCPQCLFFAVKFFQGFFYQLHVTQIYKYNCAHCTYIGILGWHIGPEKLDHEKQLVGMGVNLVCMSLIYIILTCKSQIKFGRERDN